MNYLNINICMTRMTNYLTEVSSFDENSDKYAEIILLHLFSMILQSAYLVVVVDLAVTGATQWVWKNTL